MQTCITYLPVLVMIISVSRSWNLSQRSFVSRTHSTYFNSSQLHLSLILILSSFDPFFFITWVVFGRLGGDADSLSPPPVDGERCCKLLDDPRLLLWCEGTALWPFSDVWCLKLSRWLKLSPLSSILLRRSISVSSWSLWSKCDPVMYMIFQYSISKWI